MKSPTPYRLVLSTLLLAIGLNVTACSKHEGAESKPTEEIAAEQGELARQKNPAPAASQPATPMQTASATTATATASTVTATASTVTVTATKTVNTASANTATATASNDAGEKLYNATCKTCHEAGIAGAPKFGDKAAWKDRIAQGKDVLYKHSIEGYTGKGGVMPPKGGSTASNDEMKAAVDYMVAKAS